MVDDAGRLVGILTEKDGLCAAPEASYYRGCGKPISACMTKDVVTMEPNLDLLAACQRFLDGSYRRFPVVEDGRFLGLIGRDDILRGLTENWS